MAGLTFNSVFISENITIVGKTENEGPLKYFFTKSYDDMYLGEKTWEKAEIKMSREAIKKAERNDKIDYIISGDLSNQNGISNYSLKTMNKPHISVYAACATSVLSLIIGAQFIDNNTNKVIVSTSSHNCTSEKQFRNPTEYGGDKPDYSTYTVTGSVALKLEKEGFVKVSGATIGRVIDSNNTNPNNLGCAMACAAFETLCDHLKDFKRKTNYYDLILTGDLSYYGKKVFEEMCNDHQIDLPNYNDCGLLIYDIDKQNVFAGGSGPACVGVVMGSYVIEKLRKKEYKRVLIIATGALINTIMNNQKETIPAVAHAVVLEVEE